MFIIHYLYQLTFQEIIALYDNIYSYYFKELIVCCSVDEYEVFIPVMLNSEIGFSSFWDILYELVNMTADDDHLYHSLIGD